MEVIAFVLKHLKDQLEEFLSRTINPLKAKDFDWVITVPAIWKARGKRMMREAAYMVRYVITSLNIMKYPVVNINIINSFLYMVTVILSVNIKYHEQETLYLSIVSN